jgi:DNA polymerase-3 subunit delta'
VNERYLDDVELPKTVRVVRAGELELSRHDLVCFAVPAAGLPAAVAAHGGEAVERVVTLRLGRLGAAAEAFARAPLHGTAAAERPWRALLERARARGERAREEVEAALAEELAYLPRKEHRRRESEYAERARRAERRAATGALDHALQLAGLWYRDLACVAAGAPELAFHADRATELTQDAENRDRHALTTAQELVDDTRARLILNVSEELACEALAYRLEETLSAS